MIALRWLYLAHRYLGVAVSVLMVTWCLSGVVMLYVSFPRMEALERVAALQPLDLHGCCWAAADSGFPDSATAVADIRVEMLAGHPVADVLGAAGRRAVIDLVSGEPILEVTEAQAREVALLFARQRGLPASFRSIATLENDQWTVSEHFEGERPLYKLSWPDAKASDLYVSTVSGKSMQFTTAPIRFWSWLGPVTHWVYFRPLREHGVIWEQFIILTSAISCFLTITGLYIGLRQYLRRPAGRTSPYRGYMWWHHVPGLVFGVVALTWPLSGLFSMTPYGFLEGGSAIVERQRLGGTLPRWGDVQAALRGFIGATELVNAASLRSSTLDGRLHFIATYRDGHRIRLGADGAPAALSTTDLAREAALLGGAAQPAPDFMGEPDGYYFEHHSTPAQFPVYRVVLSDSERTRFYLDSVSGEILKKVDESAREYRWLFEGLHRLDFVPRMRARPTWDVVMIVLLVGASVVSATGFYSAALRVARRPRMSSSTEKRPGP